LITLEEFLLIFKGLHFSNEELRVFYQSVSKTIILKIEGKRSWPEIFRIEEECQWPVIKRIEDPGLPIYKGADRILLDRFIVTIHNEKNLRSRKPHMDKLRYWTRLRVIIDERIELFTQIFGFSEEDVRYCEMVAARHSRMVSERAVRRKKLWTIGIGTGAATLAGAAAWYFYKKDKK
jgi:hypothetical protein